MRRGDLVTIATGGGFGGKPRRALIIQSDAYLSLTTIIVLPITSTLADPPSLLRIRLEPDEANGLRKTSEVMADLPITAKPHHVGQFLGQLSTDDLARVERALVLVLGFAG